MLVLETDGFVDLHRKHPSTVDFVHDLQGRGPVAVTAITVHELVQGAYRGANAERKTDAIRALLSAFDVLEFNGAAGWIAGRLAAEQTRKGRFIGELDTLIAATVIAHGGQLVTRNLKHFARVPGLDVLPLP